MTQRWQYQIKAEGQPPIIPAFGWFVQASEPVRVRPQHPEQAVAQPVAEHESVIPDFDWFYQQADVTRPPHQTRSGYFALVEFGIPIPPEVIDLDWFVQGPDVRAAPHQVRTGLFVLGEPPIIPAFDWLPAQPDVVRPPHSVREGGMVLGTPPIIPAFDWSVAQPDIIRSLHQTRLGLSALEFAPPVVVVPDFGWFVQGTDILVPVHQVRPGLFVIGEPPTIPDLSWYNQYPEQVIRERFRPYYYPTQEFRTELPPLVLLTQWFQAQENPVVRPLGVLGISTLPLLEVAAPALDEPVFFLRVCFALWEFEINRLLPDPSGFVTIDVEVTPSGWVQTGRNVPWEM